MIQAQDLISKFKYALDNKWGYIWGSAGITWTDARQKQKVDYMVSKYGSNWKKNSEAKNDNYYNAAVYGSKWVGHTVADCSGLFVWAFKQLGGSIYHGSNSIYDRYCSKKGKMTDDVRKNIKPGTAVFTGDSSKHGHIGLYVGNGKCIEASGTQAGVCTSNLSAGKWTYWGELKDVSFSGEQATEPTAGQDFDLIAEPAVEIPDTIRRGSKGLNVRLAQNMLYKLGYDLGPCGIDSDFGKATEAAVRDFQNDHKLTQDGIIGPKTWKALIESYDKAFPVGSAPVETISPGFTPVQTFMVTIRNLTSAEADAVVSKYPGSLKQEERKE